MDPWPYLLITAAALALLALIGLGCRRLLDNPHGTVDGGLAWYFIRLYVRLVHRLTVRGRDHIPTARDAGPFLIVSTHGAGVDPLLIQSCCRFKIHFMMASDMMLPALKPLWNWAQVIPVDRHNGDTRAAREAIRRLKQGRIVAIYPEGGITQERGVVGPFLPGVGLIVRRAGVPVLPVIIEGTPRGGTAWSSLHRFSRSTVTFLPFVDYRDSEMSAEGIAADLRDRMQAAMTSP